MDHDRAFTGFGDRVDGRADAEQPSRDPHQHVAQFALEELNLDTRRERGGDRGGADTRLRAEIAAVACESHVRQRQRPDLEPLRARVDLPGPAVFAEQVRGL